MAKVPKEIQIDLLCAQCRLEGERRCVPYRYVVKGVYKHEEGVLDADVELQGLDKKEITRAKVEGPGSEKEEWVGVHVSNTP